MELVKKKEKRFEFLGSGFGKAHCGKNAGVSFYRNLKLETETFVLLRVSVVKNNS